jgi:hypothetical protein
MQFDGGPRQEPLESLDAETVQGRRAFRRTGWSLMTSSSVSRQVIGTVNQGARSF